METQIQYTNFILFNPLFSSMIALFQDLLTLKHSFLYIFLEGKSSNNVKEMQYCNDGFALGTAYCLIILRQVGKPGIKES